MIPPGILKPLILRILETTPMHGYEIIREISARTNAFWKPTAGSIYPALGSLEREGYVQRSDVLQGERVKHVYTVTDKGRESMKDTETFSDTWKKNLDNLYNLL